MTDFKLPLTSKKEIFKLLEKREYENVPLIRVLEKELQKEQKNFIKPPKKNEPVILLLSGGLDSVVVWGILLKVFQAQVYPLMTHNYSPGQLQSAFFFEKYYKERFPEYFHSPFYLPLKTIPAFFTKRTELSKLSPQQILANYEPLIGEVLTKGLSGVSTISWVYAMQYRHFLLFNFGLEANHLIGAVTAEDGQLVPAQSLTSLRLLNIWLRHFTQDDQLQSYSLAIEPELNFAWTKSDLVKLGMGMNLPLKKTYSCDLGKIKHCGQCVSCLHRFSAMTQNHYVFKYPNIGEESLLVDDLKGIYLKLTAWVKHIRLKIRLMPSLKVT